MKNERRVSAISRRTSDYANLCEEKFYGFAVDAWLYTYNTLALFCGLFCFIFYFT